MALYNHWLDSEFYTFSTNALREDFKILDFSMRCHRDASGTGNGAAWEIEIEIPNPGLAMLSDGFPRYIAFIESPNGYAFYYENGQLKFANIFAVGRIIPASGNLGGQTVKLQIVCANTDLQGNLLAIAKGHQSLPDFDWLYSDISWTNSGSVLESTNSTWAIDPATHAISINDPIDGDRTVQINANYDFNSLEVKRICQPVATARLTVACEFLQHAKGHVDISGVLNIYGLTTLNPQHMEYASRDVPGSLMRVDLGEGWTQSNNLCHCDVGHTGALATGRQHQFDWQTYYTTDMGGGTFVGQYDHRSQVVSEYATMLRYSYTWVYNFMQFDYQQQRKELLTLLVSYPLQGGIPALAEYDLGELRLGDLFLNWTENPNPPPQPDSYGNYVYPYNPYIQVKPWSYETQYNFGDKMDRSGIIWQCTNPAGTSGYFWRVNNQHLDFKNGSYLINYYQHDDWKQVQSNAALASHEVPNFFDTDRGFKSIQHALLRARAFLRLRSQCLEVSFEGKWEDLISIGMRDRVGLDVLSVLGQGSATTQPVTGKVKSIERRWTDKGRTVRITIGVEIGTGENVVPAHVEPIQYWDPTYCTTAYVEQNTDNGHSAFSDMTYQWGTTPVVQPVVAGRLRDPLYAVQYHSVKNQAAQQYALAVGYAMQGVDPRDAALDNPTSSVLIMRNLTQIGVIERYVDVAAQIHVSPRGINLSVPGGQP